MWSLWPCCRLFRSTSVLSYSDWVGSQTGKLKDQVNTPTIVNSLDVLNEEVIVSKKRFILFFKPKILFVHRGFLHFAMHWLFCESGPEDSFIWHPTTRGRTTRNHPGGNVLLEHSESIQIKSVSTLMQTLMYFSHRSWPRTQLQLAWTVWCTSGSAIPSPLWPMCPMLTSPPVCWLRPPSEMCWVLRTWLSSCLTVRALLTACRYSCDVISIDFSVARIIFNN